MVKKDKKTAKYHTRGSSILHVKEDSVKYAVKAGSTAVKDSAAHVSKRDIKSVVNNRISVGSLSSRAKNSFVILSNSAGKPENQMTYLEKMNVVRDGISKEDLEKLKAKTSMDYDKLAKALSVTRVTLIKKKKQEKFSAGLSERIFSLADIYSYGYEVFEDEERFNKWMFRPNQALGGKTPFELINNQFGREEVKNVIGRIDYGVYS